MLGFARICIVFSILLTVVSFAGDKQKQKKIVCIGDCITRGVWWSEEIGKGTCWVDRLAKQMPGYEVVNAGLDAMESKHFWYVKDVMKNNADADIVIIYLGINDLREAKAVDPKVASITAGRIEHMVNLIRRQAPKAEIVIVAPQRVSVYNLSAKWQKAGFGQHTPVMSDLLASSLESVAQTQKVRFVSLLDLLKSADLPDGVHPGREGHEKIAEYLATELTHPKVLTADPIFAEVKKVAPPAAGKPIINDSAADEVAAGIQGDLMAFRGPEAKKKNAADLTPVRLFVPTHERESFVSEEAYRFAQATGNAMFSAVEKELEWQEASGVEAVYDRLVSITPEDEVQITYEIPQEPVAEAFITSISVPEHEGYEVLGESVDWSGVKTPEVFNNVRIETADKAKVESIKVTQALKESKDVISKVAAVVPEVVKIEDIRESVDLPVAPEESVSEILFPEGSLVPGIPAIGVIREDAKVREEISATKKGGLEPLEVPGYEVFVHTFPEK